MRKCRPLSRQNVINKWIIICNPPSSSPLALFIKLLPLKLYTQASRWKQKPNSIATNTQLIPRLISTILSIILNNTIISWVAQALVLSLALLVELVSSSGGNVQRDVCLLHTFVMNKELPTLRPFTRFLELAMLPNCSLSFPLATAAKQLLQSLTKLKLGFKIPSMAVSLISLLSSSRYFLSKP